MTTPDADHEDFQQAVRTLVMHPLLTTTGGHAASVALVHAQKDPLRDWFDRHLGWQLAVDRDVVRLFKVPEDWPTHPTDAPSQRRCVLYCLVLAAMDDCGEQTVITELAEKVSVLAATYDDIPNFDAEQFRERQDLVFVLRLLVDQGVLTPTRDAGTTEQDERAYVNAEGNALYDINHRAAAVIISSPVAPSRAGTPERLTEETMPDTAEAQNRRRRIALMRRLVDTPALYFTEIPDDQVAYFHSQRHLLLQEIARGLATRVEVRQEGAAVIDDELTDLPFPKERTAQFAALAFAELLAAEPELMTGNATVPDHRLDAIGAGVTDRVSRVAKTIAGRPVTPAQVRSVALDMLAKLRLVAIVDGGVRTLPALARYRNPLIRYPGRADAAQPSLFDTEPPTGAEEYP